MTGEAELTAVAVSEEVREWLPVATMADLRLMKPTAKRFIQLLGYYSAGDGGGGEFYFDPTSEAVHNGGTIIAPDAGGVGRWKRIVTNSTVTIQQFGADGSGDDVTYIQAALDAGYSYVEASDGTFGCSTTLTVPANTHLTGDATLTFTGTPDVTTKAAIILNGTSAIVTGLSINITAGNYQRGIQLKGDYTRASRNKINVTTNDITAATPHYVFFSSNLPTTYQSVEISDNDVQCSGVPLADGAQVSGQRGMKILRNRFHDMTVDVPNEAYWGIYVSSDCEDVLVADNVIEDTDGSGIHVNSVVGTPNRRIVVRGNTIADVGYHGLSFDAYVLDSVGCENKITGTSRAIYVGSTSARIVVANNNVKRVDTAAGADGALIVVTGSSCIVHGNSIDDRNNATTGIYVAASGCSVIGNVFGSTRPRLAIQFTSAAVDGAIVGNVIATTDDSTAASAIDADAARLLVLGNRIVHPTAASFVGIRVGDSNILCQGNVISGCATGIFITGSTSSIVIDNQITGQSGSAINDSGTTTRIRNNVGFTTEAGGTGTINSGATTATITHGLSKTPSAANIAVVFTEQGTNDYGRWWVDTIGATTFKVNVSADPGASNLDFSWQAAIV